MYPIIYTTLRGVDTRRGTPEGLVPVVGKEMPACERSELGTANDESTKANLVSHSITKTEAILLRTLFSHV